MRNEGGNLRSCVEPSDGKNLELCRCLGRERRREGKSRGRERKGEKLYEERDIEERKKGEKRLNA